MVGASAPTLIRISYKISPSVQKLQEAPDKYRLGTGHRFEHIDICRPRFGLYFYYGTLIDPCLLLEKLILLSKLRVRPAKVCGYSLKLCGQYPALVDGPFGLVVKGMVYIVEHDGHAERLAEYETKACRPSPCLICFTDNEVPREASGTTLKYVENPVDISKGMFDIKVWLKRMGRPGTEGEAF
jgi:gamma-glutamylcyclotransferase (GGCT)/AIG2-like uncharacterized protein YtfP